MNAAHSSPPGRELHGLLAEFANADDLLAATRRTRDAGFARWDAYAPWPIEGLAEAVGIRRTRLGWWVFAFGILGAVGGLALQWWTNAIDYPYLTSGKPLFSLPANIPVAFEMAILFAALAAGLGMLALNGLPRLYHALFTNPRFARATTDGFFICIEAADPMFDEAAMGEFLASLGAVGIERIEHVPRTPVPRWMVISVSIVLLLAVVPPVWIVYARQSDSAQPPIHLIHDMDRQGTFKAQEAKPESHDGRSMSPAIRGTIARGTRPPDEHFDHGLVNGGWATGFPRDLTNEDIEDGQARYEIFCAPCHALDGSGLGPVTRRAESLSEPNWVSPQSLLDPQVRNQPVGQLYHTITYGARNMPAFGNLIPATDRWAIVAYVKQLQLESAPRTQPASESATRPD